MAVATLVDPRYRGKLFSASELSTANASLLRDADAVQVSSTQDESTTTPSGSAAADDAVEPPRKRRCLAVRSVKR